MNLITGRTGTDHILARHDALIHKTLLGPGDYVLTYGNNMEYSAVDASHISIGTGALIMQGRLCEITSAESVALTVCTSSSLKRKSIVVAEYTISNAGIEDVDIVVISGDESSNTYVEPTVTHKDGDIDNGETHQMPLYAVYIDGFAIDSVEQLFVLMAVDALTTGMEYAKDFVSNLHDEVDQEIADMKSRASGTIPVITASTREPTSEDGDNGEFWVIYEAPEEEEESGGGSE